MIFLIVISLFLLWNLEFIATLLNIKAFPSTPPPELEGLMDQEKLDKALTSFGDTFKATKGLN